MKLPLFYLPFSQFAICEISLREEILDPSVEDLQINLCAVILSPASRSFQTQTFIRRSAVGEQAACLVPYQLLAGIEERRNAS